MAYDLPKEAILKELDLRVDEKLALSGHCAQTSFAVLDEQFNLDGGATLKALTPLPGIALRGETCGAVIGCLMALGLVYGRDDLEDSAGFFSSLPPAREFCRRFEQQVGGTNCHDILESDLGYSFDLAKQADFQKYLECGGIESCTEVIRKGVRIAAEIIIEQEKSDQDQGVMLTV
jgi:C_GCAxxG_C_C family probable redox protein